MRSAMKRMREHRLEGSYRCLLDLLSVDLDAQLQKNITAEGNQVYRNQGAAQYLKSLLKELGFDPDKKAKTYDGAFD